MSVKKLRSENIAFISSIFEGFYEALLENCSSHALYRGEIFGDSAGNIRCEMIATNIKGSFEKKYLLLDLESNTMFHSKGLVFDNEKAVQAAYYQLIADIVGRLPWTMNRIYFDISKRFKVGSVESLANSDEKNLYLIGESDMRYLLKSDNDDKKNLVGEICKPWMSKSWVQEKNTSEGGDM